MKKIKYLLLAVVAMVVCSCGVAIEDVAEEVRVSVKEQLEKDFGTSVYVGDVVLVHKGGNDYESVVDITADGETERFSLKVVFDGETFVWTLE